jgi:hypothetical protein
VLKKLLVPLVIVLLVVPLAIFAVGCSSPSAEQIAKDSMRASENIDTSHFVVSSSLQLPRAPIQNGKVSQQEYTNDSSGDINQKTGDLQVTQELASGVHVTALQSGKKTYIQLAGTWYEAPQSFQVAAPVTQTLSISQYVKYFKTLTKLGDTKIDGEGCYHLQAVPDMKQLVKLPGITDLLKDPTTGKQIRTVDELADLKAVLDFYIRKKDSYMKRMSALVEVRAWEDLIKLGYAEAGDRVKDQQQTTLSKYNEKLNLEPPTNVKPWPAQ